MESYPWIWENHEHQNAIHEMPIKISRVRGCGKRKSQKICDAANVNLLDVSSSWWKGRSNYCSINPNSFNFLQLSQNSLVLARREITDFEQLSRKLQDENKRNSVWSVQRMLQTGRWLCGAYVKKIRSDYAWPSIKCWSRSRNRKILIKRLIWRHGGICGAVRGKY